MPCQPQTGPRGTGDLVKGSELWQCGAAGSAELSFTPPQMKKKKVGKLCGKSELAKEEFGYGKSNQLAPSMFPIAVPALGSHRLLQAQQKGSSYLRPAPHPGHPAEASAWNTGTCL